MVAGESGDNDKNGNFWDSCCRSCSIFWSNYKCNIIQNNALNDFLFIIK
jgi:hypothetical protein